MLLLMMLAGCGLDAHQAADEPLGTCEVEGVPPAALRLLSRAELDNTLRDLLAYAWDGAVGQECAQDTDCEVFSEHCDAGVCAYDRCTQASFVLADDGFDTVHVAGEFNGWPQTIEEGGWPLRLQGDTWVGKFELYTGSLEYKLVVNGEEWWTDPNRDATADDGYGGLNSVITVDCTTDQAFWASPAQGFPAESRPEGFSFDNASSTGLVSSTTLSAALEMGAGLAPVAVDDALVGCTDCVEFVEAFGQRAFRRPLSDSERERYAALSDELGPEVVVQAMLASPHFLYRPEIGDAAGRLSGWETASALSYFFWATMPDDALMDAAAAGELDTLAGVDAAARRLMADPRSEAALRRFAVQWLEVEELKTATRSWDASTRDALIEEAARFVSEAIRYGSYADLMTADWTVADARVARYYELTPPDDWEVVSRPPERAGVLGLAAVLSAAAHSDQTSPVRRGLFVREQLLCHHLADPPPDAGGVPDVDPDATTRERFEQHSADPGCAACHDWIDPIGFGFEHFGPLGQWRDSDAGQPVDASAWVVDLEALGAGTVDHFDSLPELGGLLAGSEAAQACFSTQLHRFATGAVVEDCASSGESLEELMIGVACSDTFLYREQP